MDPQRKGVSRVVKVGLDHIILDKSYQPRGWDNDDDGLDSLDGEHIERLLASNPEDWPPLLLTPSADSESDFVLLDGWHRYTAAYILEVATLRCEIIEHGGIEEAFAANTRHGLPLDRADRKAYARWLHGTYSDLSYREIGRRVGLDAKTVKAALTEAEEIPQQGSGANIASPTGSHLGAEEYAKRLSRALHVFVGSITGQHPEERRVRLLVEVGKGTDRAAAQACATEYRALAISLQTAATHLEQLR